MQQGRAQRGFTLIEMMITMVIVAVLASLAVTALHRHLRQGRIMTAQVTVSKITAAQEGYRQEHGEYAAASGSTYAGSSYYPTMQGNNEPIAKAWVGVPAGLLKLPGIAPDSRYSYFSYKIVASQGPNHALDTVAARTGIAAQPTSGTLEPHPWFYVVAQADLDGDANVADGCDVSSSFAGTACTVITASNAHTGSRVFESGE